MKNASEDGELRKSSGSNGTSASGKIPVIKLQLIRKGKTKDALVDLDLDNAAASVNF